MEQLLVCPEKRSTIQRESRFFSFSFFFFPPHAGGFNHHVLEVLQQCNRNLASFPCGFKHHVLDAFQGLLSGGIPWVEKVAGYGQNVCTQGDVEHGPARAQYLGAEQTCLSLKLTHEVPRS